MHRVLSPPICVAAAACSLLLLLSACDGSTASGGGAAGEGTPAKALTDQGKCDDLGNLMVTALKQRGHTFSLVQNPDQPQQPPRQLSSGGVVFECEVGLTPGTNPNIPQTQQINSVTVSLFDFHDASSTLAEFQSIASEFSPPPARYYDKDLEVPPQILDSAQNVTKDQIGWYDHDSYHGPAIGDMPFGLSASYDPILGARSGGWALVSAPSQSNPNSNELGMPILQIMLQWVIDIGFNGHLDAPG